MILLTYIKLYFLTLVQDSKIFVPKQPNIEQAKSPEEYGLQGVSEHFLVLGNNEKIYYWLKDEENINKPIFIIFHGNTGHFGDVGKPQENEVYDRRYRLNLIKEIIKNDADFMAVSLRGYGKSEGKSSEANFAEDISKIAELIGEKNYKNIIILGESLGANSALKLNEKLLEKNIEVKKVALIAPFLSLLKFVEDKFPEFKKVNLIDKLKYKFDNKKIISETKSEAEFLLFHPIKDLTTNFNNSEILFEAGEKNNLNIKLFAMENCGHITWKPDFIVKEILK
jgi:alpha-beta hydrolase superfamily lysophospholipase